MKLVMHVAVSLLSITLMTDLFSATQTTTCKQNMAPHLVKTIGDYAIIARDITSVPAANAFSGGGLTYTQSSQPSDPKNAVSIDRTTGEITIKANAADNFDITVTAANACGSAVVTFNIEIAEEQ